VTQWFFHIYYVRTFRLILTFSPLYALFNINRDRKSVWGLDPHLPGAYVINGRPPSSAQNRSTFDSRRDAKSHQTQWVPSTAQQNINSQQFQIVENKSWLVIRVTYHARKRIQYLVASRLRKKLPEAHNSDATVNIDFLHVPVQKYA